MSAGSSSERVRVALVGPYPLDPTRVAGGVETAFTTLVSGLARTDGVEASVITFDASLDESRHVDVDGVRVLYLPGTQRFGNLTSHRRERRLLAEALAEIEPDIVHAQDSLRYGYACLTTANAPVVEQQQPLFIIIHRNRW